MKIDVQRVERELGLALDPGDVVRLERARKRAPFADLPTLVEEVLVHETWFFRDAAVFEGLVEAARARPGPLRVLSAPCSTGEEAYSAAIALWDAGMRADAFTVVGVDVSDRALASATRARYGASSFRSARAPGAVRWLDHVGAEWIVPAEIGAAVRFRRQNLVAHDALADEAPFDVVLCRNLLVYLSDDGRSRLGRVLARVVAPGGLLFLGHADVLADPAFVREGAPERFAWRRVEDLPAATPSRRRARSVDRLAPVPLAEPVRSPPASRGSLELARRLADAGEVEQAAALCEGLLAERGHDAESYALLGTLHHARGRNEEAVQAWRRAVYLDPAHPEALVQLGLSFRGRGEGARAAALLARAARARRIP